MTKKSLKKAWRSNASRKNTKKNKTKDKHRKSRHEIENNPNNIKRREARRKAAQRIEQTGGADPFKLADAARRADRRAALDLSREENFEKLKFETVKLSSGAARLLQHYIQRQEEMAMESDDDNDDDDDSDDGIEEEMVEFGTNGMKEAGDSDGIVIVTHASTETESESSSSRAAGDVTTPVTPHGGLSELQKEMIKYGFNRDHVLQVSHTGGQSKTSLAKTLFIKSLQAMGSDGNEILAQLDELRTTNASFADDREELKMLIEDEITALESIFEGTMSAEHNDHDGSWVIQVDFEADFSMNGGRQQRRRVRGKRADGAAQKTSDSKDPWQLHVHIPGDSIYPYEPPICLIKPPERQSENPVSAETLQRVCLAMTRECIPLNGAGVVFSIHYHIKENARTLFVEAPKPQREQKERAKIDTAAKHKESKKTPSRGDNRATPRTPSGASKQDKSKVITRAASRHDLTSVPSETYQSDAQLQKTSKALQRDLSERMQKPQFKVLLEKRSQLPAFAMRHKILQMLSDNQVIIISGETGCGKTTQVPQFLLDEMIKNGMGAQCNIVVTQPRRLSAIGVAERVATERCVSIGGEVGYTIALESRRSRDTRLTFCTTGILLKVLENFPLLEGYSHIVIDEVHERSIDSDFLLIVMRNLLHQRPDLKLILMSATLNAERFSEYFYYAPTLHIPGRTFPVKSYFLEDAIEVSQYSLNAQSPYASRKQNDRARSMYRNYSPRTQHSMANLDENKINYELISALVKNILDRDKDPNNAILIFMPGIQEITELYNELNLPASKCDVIPLHSSLSSINQRRVFDPPKPGVRKVVIATNIAETSITIDNVTWVIDSGKMKEMEYDSSAGMNVLKEKWISKANALQREGRAGRVKPGTCYHLFSKFRFEKSLEESQRPEMLRVSLEQICLRIKALDMEGSVEDVLDEALDPPKKKDIVAALRQLRMINALRHDESLTPLGMHLTQLPVDARLGKMIIYGALFRCLDPILTIGACLGFQSPFVSPVDSREEARKAHQKISVEKSDHLSILRAYNTWIRMRREGKERVFCDSHYLSVNTLRQITERKKQFVELLSSIGFLELTRTGRQNMRLRAPQSEFILGEDHPMNLNSRNIALLKACLCAGLYPQILLIQEPDIGEIKFLTGNSGAVDIHPSSVLHKADGFENSYLVFMERVKTSKVFIRDATMVSPYALMIFGDRYAFDRDRQMVVLDGWARLRCSRRVALLMFEMRQRVQLYMRRQIDDPQFHLSEHATELIDTLSVLLGNEKSIHNDPELEREIFGDIETP